MDFSVILQNPQIRGLVQDGVLERAFHDALVPRLLFRQEVTPIPWPGGIGDTMIFSAPGLVSPDARPLRPGDEPDLATYHAEQWTATVQQYAKAIDTHMPSSMMAIANLFLRNTQQLGIQAGMTLNRLVRNRLYATAMSGWTTANGAATTTTSVKVHSLNGFTRARNPTTAGASQIQFGPVTSSNPLAIKIYDNSAETSNTVIAYTPDNAGDEFGPGTLTLGTQVTSVADRAYIFATDASNVVRVGGGNKVDDLASNDVPTLTDVRTCIANFWQDNVPEHPDGRFHAHIDPISNAKLMGDTEFRTMLTALPDYYMYKQFAIGELLNTIFIRNSECPVKATVEPKDGTTFSMNDPFPGELYSNGNASTGVPVHRILFTAQGGIMEYYADLNALLTEVGIAGKVGEPSITNNGIEIFTDRIQLVIRQPMNRLADMVSTAWKFIGDWPTRTDAETGTGARYKRAAVIEHGA